MLSRLGPWCHDRRGKVLIAWVVLLFVGFGVSGVVGDAFRDEFGGQGESKTGFDLLDEHFGGQGTGITGTIVFEAPQGVDDPAVREGMEKVFADVAEEQGVVRVDSPYSEEGAQQISERGDGAGKIAYANVELDEDIEFTRATEIRDEVEKNLPEIEGLRTEFGGFIFADFENPSSETIGLAFAIIILIVAFGSVLAMGLPIGVALFGIGLGTALTTILSQLVTVPEFATFLGIMIGLGVGIDYALLIVTRYREQLHGGHSVRDSVTVAIDTAGRSVLFAGITVVISLLSMILMQVTFVTGLAISAALVVALTVAASLTLLPALLGFAKHRIELTRWRGLIAAALIAVGLAGVGLKIYPLALLFLVAIVVLILGLFLEPLKREVPHRPPKPRDQTTAYRWSRVIQHRPWPAAILGTVVLLILAIPVLGLRLGFSDESNFADDTTTKQAYDLLVEGFGAGFAGPMLLVAELPEGTGIDAVAPITEAAEADRGVVLVSPPIPNDEENPTAVLWNLVPTTGPQDAVTTHTVNRLRNDVLPAAEQAAGVEVAVTGSTAANIDFSRVPRRAAPVLLRCRAHVVLPAAHGRVPVAARAVEGRPDEPALDRRRLRHRRRPVPVGLAQQHHRRAAGADRAVGADDALRHRLRPVDGLRGVPALTGAGGVAPHR